jgi:hypothetical protein
MKTEPERTPWPTIPVPLNAMQPLDVCFAVFTQSSMPGWFNSGRVAPGNSHNNYGARCASLTGFWPGMQATRLVGGC